MKIHMHGYLGGRNANWKETLPMLEKHIRPLPTVDMGLKLQCRCGGTERALWRRRWYCPRCGRWLHATNPTLAIRAGHIPEVAKGLGSPECDE